MMTEAWLMMQTLILRTGSGSREEMRAAAVAAGIVAAAAADLTVVAAGTRRRVMVMRCRCGGSGNWTDWRCEQRQLLQQLSDPVPVPDSESLHPSVRLLLHRRHHAAAEGRRGCCCCLHGAAADCCWDCCCCCASCRCQQSLRRSRARSRSCR